MKCPELLSSSKDLGIVTALVYIEMLGAQDCFWRAHAAAPHVPHFLPGDLASG